MEDETPISREGQFFDGFTWRNNNEAEDTSGQSAANAGLAHELSERELQIIRLMQGKLTAKQIATSLLISHRTVQFHMDSMYWKLGCSGRGARDQAVVKGRKLGIIK
jgi:DNA-binding NarL/FixJ family response regulator